MRTARTPRETLVRRMVVAYGANNRDWETSLQVEQSAQAIVDGLSDHQVAVALRGRHPRHLYTVKEEA